jgi:protein-tyrosine phosphatase
VIDLHAHILPGIDDGPAWLEDSVAFARAAADAGTHLITATPHLRSDFPDVRLEELADRCHALDRVLADEGVGVRIVPGAEVDLLWARAASPEELRLATYGQGGTDMLLETPYGPLPPNFGAMLESITEQGIRILLAHPERNPSFQRDPQLVLDLVARGVLVQVTAMSLAAGRKASRSLRLARWLGERDAVHVIASDAHTEGPWRGPDLRPALNALGSISPARLEWIVHEVPQAIVAGEPVPRAPSGSAARRGLGPRPVRAMRRVLGARST